MKCFHALTINYIKEICVALCLLLQILSFSARGQERGMVFPEWRYFDNPDKWLYKYLADDALELLHQRDAQVAELKTAEDWRGRQKQIKQTFDRILGPFPERTPLNAVVTEVIKREDVTVEKVYFESLPGYYVTGAFFRPTNNTSKLPVVIYCSGHSAQGFRGEVYQRVILNYVKKGFAVFAFDPIGQGERKQYAASEHRQTFGPTQEHSYPGSLSFLLGRSPAYYFIWDGIRAVDYVCSRAEVDTARIGITGRSGGGTQTAYIAAFDSRIKASAPECYLTSYEKLLLTGGPQDAEQNFAKSIFYGLDITDLVVMFAPKPMRMLTTTRDIFSIQGARDVFQEAKNAYEALGAPEHVSMVEDDAAHESTQANREAGYQFFQQYLNNPGNAGDEEVAYFSEEELFVTKGGRLDLVLKSHTLHSLAKLQLDKTIEQRKEIRDKNDLLARVYDVTGFKTPVAPEAPVFSGRYRQGAYNMEKYLLKTAKGYYIPVLWLKPSENNEQRPAILVLDDEGKTHGIKEGGYADSLARAGYEVVLPDLSGYGEMGSGYFKRGDAMIDQVPLNLWYAGMLVNRSLVGIRMEEISLILDWMKSERKSVVGVASGTLTTDLLHAAFVRQDDFQSLVLINPLESVQSLVAVENYRPQYLLSAADGMLAKYDLPHLLRFFSQEKAVLRINSRNGEGNLMPEEAIQHSLTSNVSDLSIGNNGVFHSINSWLRNAAAN